MAEPSMDQTMNPGIIRMVKAVVAVPVSRRLEYGSAHGHITGGVLVGRSDLGFVTDPPSSLHVSRPSVRPGIAPIVLLTHGDAMSGHHDARSRAPDLLHGAAR